MSGLEKFVLGCFICLMVILSALAVEAMFPTKTQVEMITINLPPGEKFVAYNDAHGLTYVTRPMRTNEFPELFTIRGIEARITFFQESR